MDPQQVFNLTLAAFFVALNGFFVLSEFALVKVRRSKLEELVKNKVTNSKLALKMASSVDTYLSACQLGITLASLALGWLGEPAFASLIRAPLEKYTEFSNAAIHTIAFIIAFTCITLLHVVLGEQAPKLVAIAKSEKVVLWIVRPLYVFWVIFFPIIKIFDYIASSAVRVAGIRQTKDGEHAHSEEEIKIIVGESFKDGVLDTMESEIIQNAVDFGDTVAKEVMTPRKDMVCLDKQNSLEENLKIIRDSKFTRFPYIDGNKDSVIGLIHIRDIIQSELDKTKIHLDKIVRKFVIVPENSSVSTLLKMMNKERISAVLVLDEYGGTAGFLTMEDIIEEIFGDIRDEHDKEIINYKQISDDEYEFNGRFELEEIEDMLEIAFDEETEQLTIGGYVFNLFERLPIVGDKIEDENCTYEVLEIDGGRIAKVKLTLKYGANNTQDTNSLLI